MNNLRSDSSKKRERSFWRSIILFFSSSFGLGYLPKAPGTWGTLLALPLWWSLSQLSLADFAEVTFAISIFSVFVADQAERFYGSHDVQHITIDEVAGMLVTAIGVPFTAGNMLVAFGLFRLLDATKPPPIGWVDRRVGGGFGVVFDDILAGLMACGLLHTMHYVKGSWL